MPLDLPLDGGTATPIDSDQVAARVEAEARPVEARGRWLTVNMVTSIDGATAIGGVSGALGGELDRQVFQALRGAADVVLAGSGTVVAERYRPPRVDASTRRRRGERGQAEVPRLAVVSNQGSLPLDLPLFAESAAGRPLVIVAAGAVPADRRRALDGVAEVVEAGEGVVDLELALDLLARRAGPRILCEGGPTLNGLLVGADLIDEWCLTVSPLLASGDSARAAAGPVPPVLRRLRLDRAWLGEGELVLRYLRHPP